MHTGGCIHCAWGRGTICCVACCSGKRAASMLGSHCTYYVKRAGTLCSVDLIANLHNTSSRQQRSTDNSRSGREAARTDTTTAGTHAGMEVCQQAQREKRQETGARMSPEVVHQKRKASLPLPVPATHRARRSTHSKAPRRYMYLVEHHPAV